MNVIKNDKAIDADLIKYVKLYAPTTAWGSIISMNLGLPALRGYWSMSSVDEGGDIYDISGQGRKLTRSP